MIVAAAGLVLAALVALLWWQHDRAALQRDPSYVYGQSVMDIVEGQANGGHSAKEVCAIAIASRSAPFAHYSRAKARAGCMDEWTALNE